MYRLQHPSEEAFYTPLQAKISGGPASNDNSSFTPPPVMDNKWVVAAALHIMGGEVGRSSTAINAMQHELQAMTLNRNDLAHQLNQAHARFNSLNSQSMEVILNLQTQLLKMAKQQEELHALQLVDKDKTAEITALKLRLQQIGSMASL